MIDCAGNNERLEKMGFACSVQLVATRSMQALNKTIGGEAVSEEQTSELSDGIQLFSQLTKFKNADNILDVTADMRGLAESFLNRLGNDRVIPATVKMLSVKNSLTERKTVNVQEASETYQVFKLLAIIAGEAFSGAMQNDS